MLACVFCTFASLCEKCIYVITERDTIIVCSFFNQAARRKHQAHQIELSVSVYKRGSKNTLHKERHKGGGGVGGSSSSS